VDNDKTSSWRIPVCDVCIPCFNGAVSQCAKVVNVNHVFMIFIMQSQYKSLQNVIMIFASGGVISRCCMLRRCSINLFSSAAAVSCDAAYATVELAVLFLRAA